MLPIIWCHGGSFGGGDVNWDPEVRHCLTDAGFVVHTVDFSLFDFEQAVVDVIISVKQFQAVAVGGTSSGAFLAHIAANACRISALLIAPVTKPFARHNMLPETYQKLQLQSFHTLDKMRHFEESFAVPNAPRVIVVGALDTTRARLDSFLQEWCRSSQKLSVTIVPQDHSEVCSKLSPEIMSSCVNSLKKQTFT